VLLGLPYDASSSLLRGPAAAPALIRLALDSDSSNGWSESLIDLRAPGVLGDRGDVDVGGPEVVRARIESAVSALLDDGGRPLCLGGDHSVTYPVLRAIRPRYPRLELLHIDAHPDLYDALDGDRYSHACPFARIMEEGLVDRLVQVGIRTMNGHQRVQADRFGVEVIPMQDWDDGRVLSFDSPLYVSIDLDALDPAFAPGVSHREPGGFSTRSLVRLLQRMRATVIGGDIVELNPTVDPAGITPWVAAKLVRELSARMLETAQPRRS
jgi:agmatinase